MFDAAFRNSGLCGRMVPKVLTVVTFCLAQLLLTNKRIYHYGERSLNSRLSSITTITTSSSSSSSSLVNRIMLDDDPTVKNTYWRNVEYHSGDLQNLSQSERDYIVDVCSKQSGYSFVVNLYPNDPNTVGMCYGPLVNNTSCCYCYVSRDYEELLKENTNSYRFYKCAVPRNHSLLPLNATPRVDNNTAHGAQVAWITGKFGHNDRFQQEIEYYCQQVKDMNILDPDHMYCYGKEPDYALRRREYRRHLQYRQDPNDASSRGGGYWFHKSLLLQHHLKQYQHGDLLVYTDADRMDFFRLGSLHAIIDTMTQRPEDDLCIDIIGGADEAVYTKEDMFAAFNSSQAIRDSPQFIANIIVVRNTPTMKVFMDAWAECMADWHMVSDEPSVLPNVYYFYENRHDQSALGLLIKEFMSLQVVVGPPARPFHFMGEFVTYKFKQGADPTCPFNSYYFQQYKANALLLRKHNITI